jgi:hypothetical protein
MTIDATVTRYRFAIAPSVSPRCTSCTSFADGVRAGARSAGAGSRSGFCLASSDFAGVGFTAGLRGSGGAGSAIAGVRVRNSPAAMSARTVTRRVRDT